MSSQAAVEITALTKTYRQSHWRRSQVRALNGIDLSVAPGSIFGLVGPNGAGKTTVLKALTGAVPATSGNARIFGEAAGSRAAARQIGYLPESYAFPGHLTATQLLELHGALMGLDRDYTIRRSRALLDLAGIAEWRNLPLGKYSKGMMQRAGLAQAMLHQPRLLILDEPTDGLDPAARALVLDVLRALNREGLTLFINSHHLDEIQSLCSHVAILDRGTVVGRQTVGDLASGGFVLTLSALSSEAIAALRQRASLVPADAATAGLVRFHFSLRSDVDWAIDHIRNDGRGCIESLIPAARTLTEVFLTATRREAV